MSGQQAEVFEVQTLNNGRWTIESRCRTEQQAIAEAREFFDRRLCTGVKVVKEAYDETASLYREFTVFRLPASTTSPGPQASASAAKPKAPTSAQPSAKSAAPRRRSLFDLLTNRS